MGSELFLRDDRNVAFVYVYHLLPLLVSQENVTLGARISCKLILKWLSDEAVKIADERREVRNKEDDQEYRRLNAAFQRRARQDKEQGIKAKCRQIEESNKM